MYFIIMFFSPIKLGLGILPYFWYGYYWFDLVECISSRTNIGHYRMF